MGDREKLEQSKRARQRQKDTDSRQGSQREDKSITQKRNVYRDIRPDQRLEFI